MTSQVIIDFLDSLFTRWGLPNTITTDNGPQMILAELTTYLKAKGIITSAQRTTTLKLMGVLNASTSH